jgi:hypothetical protein
MNNGVVAVLGFGVGEACTKSTGGYLVDYDSMDLPLEAPQVSKMFRHTLQRTVLTPWREIR